MGPCPVRLCDSTCLVSGLENPVSFLSSRGRHLCCWHPLTPTPVRATPLPTGLQECV